MASFFESPPPPLEPPERQEPPRRPWHGPSGAVVGRSVALNLVLGRSEKAALWIPSLVVYPDGFEFSVEIRHRLDEEEFGHPFFMHLHHPRQRRRPEGGLDPDFVRLGIEFSDGGRATNLTERMPFAVPGEPDEPPQGPVLGHGRGGGGGGGRWEITFWVWPLPPPGPLAFVCEWPVADIPETRQEIKSALVRDAAGDAAVLWPDEHRSGSGGGGLSTFQTISAISASPRAEPPEPPDPDAAA